MPGGAEESCDLCACSSHVADVDGCASGAISRSFIRCDGCATGRISDPTWYCIDSFNGTTEPSTVCTVECSCDEGVVDLECVVEPTSPLVVLPVGTNFEWDNVGEGGVLVGEGI